MHTRTIDVVTDWETVATPAGYEGLRRLADREFSGAVSAGPAWAFFLNGRIVGVFEGTIEDFEDADATAYRATDPSLPLLFAMQERGGETRANYYTNETPLREVDQTLESGGFTGYIELSENVLSGDYYVVYHGGKSMSAAFIGSSERLVTGEEAFETAADEVGIYEVVDVGIDLVDIPEPDVGEVDEGSDDADPAGAAAAGGVAADGAAGRDRSTPDSGADVDAPGAPEEPVGPDPGPEADADRVSELEQPAGTEPSAGATPRSDDGDGGGAAAGPAVEPDRDPEPESGVEPDVEPDVDDEPEDDETGSVDGEAAAGAAAEAAGDDTEGADPAAGADAEPPTPDRGADDGAAPGGAGGADSLTDEERWQRARTIPSLDPEASTGNGEADADSGRDRGAARERAAQMQRQRRRRRAARDPAESDTASEAAAPSRGKGGGQGDREGAEALQQQLASARERIESLEAERDDLRREREELAEERDALRDERTERAERIEELEAECERLRSEVDRLQSRLDAEGGAASESMSPDRALSGTNLFVRYDTKGRATLKHAHEGTASRSDVDENLRLEHHTTFESEGVAVGGQPYEEFLHDSTEYAFSRWVVSDLLYEIGGTGNRSELAGVFDAIPDIDRIELYGEVGVETDDGVEQRGFDVVFRDRMGDPLFVADINPSRDATTEAMVGSLVENTHTVATEAETLATGFYVTESFFEPAALETVADRTGGGLLSRSKKRSFVKLSRKRGYHLCLVEARDGEFHLNVPEL